MPLVFRSDPGNLGKEVFRGTRGSVTSLRIEGVRLGSESPSEWKRFARPPAPIASPPIANTRRITGIK